MSVPTDACASCSDKFVDPKNVIECNSCKKQCHIRCDGNVEFRGLHKKKSTWKCVKCSMVIISEPSQSIKRYKCDSGDVVEVDRMLLQSLISKIDELVTLNQNSKSQLEKVVDDNLSLVTKIDDLTASVDDLNNQLKSLRIEKSSLSKSTDNTSYTSAIRSGKPKTNNKSAPFVFGSSDNKQLTNKQCDESINKFDFDKAKASPSFSTHQVKAAIADAIKSIGDAESSSNKEAFQIVKNKKQKKRLPKPKPVLIGSKTVSVEKGQTSVDVLQGTERRQWVYVGRVRVGATVDSIKKYIESNFGITDVKCFLLKQYEEICSFKVGVLESFLPELLKPEKWPKNIAVREFVMLPNSRQRPKTAVFPGQSASSSMDFQQSTTEQDKT